MNPYDVFPRRSLPNDAEPWGRVVEQRIVQAEDAVLSGQERLTGLNRTASSSLESIARQAAEVQTQVERVRQLHDALPKAFSQSASDFNFGLSGSGWRTITTLTFNPPDTGKCVLTATASGQMRSNTTTGNVEASYRLIVGSAASPVFPGDWGQPAGAWGNPDGVWRNVFFLSFAWNLNVQIDAPVSVALQVLPEQVSSWPSGTGSTATLNGFATFTRGGAA